MATDQPRLEFKSVWSGVRPHRVAILTPSNGGMTEWLQAIEVCSQLWGGVYCIAVPTDGKNISEPFWKLLKIYDPDILVRMPGVKISGALGQEVLRRLNPLPSLAEQQSPYQFSPIWPDNIPYPLTRASSVVERGDFDGCSCPLIVANPLIETLAYAYTGRLTKQSLEELQAQGIATGHPDYDLHKYPEQVRKLWQLAWEERDAYQLDAWGKLPRDLSRIHLGAYSDSGTNWYAAPVVLIVGQTTDDFCLFYSMSHTRPNVFWAPLDLLEAVPDVGSLPMDDLSANTVFHMAHSLHNRLTRDSSERRLLVTSLSCDTGEMVRAVRKLERARLVKAGKKTLEDLATVEFRIEELLLYRYVAWESNNSLRSTAHAVQIVDSESVGYLDVRPKHFAWTFDRHIIWVTELDIEGYQLPQRRVFNDKVLLFQGLGPPARISSTGVAFDGVRPMIMAGSDMDAVVAKPRLKVTSPLSLFSQLFEDKGYSIQVSDKGAYQEGALSRFGGIDAFIADFVSSRSKVLEKFLDLSPNKPGITDQGMKIRDRRYLDFAAIASKLEATDEHVVKELLTEYLYKGIFQRGFALKCPECRQSDWYEVTEVSEFFRCSRCRTAQTYEPEVPWIYRLNELVFQCLNSGVSTHILTLGAIREWAKRGSFLFVPPINVFELGKLDHPYAEIDVACIVDGQLVIGECKDNGSISKADRQQLAKYETLAKKLQADVIVFGALSDKLSKGTTDFLEKRNSHLSKFGIDLRPLPLLAIINRLQVQAGSFSDHHSAKANGRC